MGASFCYDGSSAATQEARPRLDLVASAVEGPTPSPTRAPWVPFSRPRLIASNFHNGDFTCGPQLPPTGALIHVFGDWGETGEPLSWGRCASLSYQCGGQLWRGSRSSSRVSHCLWCVAIVFSCLLKNSRGGFVRIRAANLSDHCNLPF